MDSVTSRELQKLDYVGSFITPAPVMNSIKVSVNMAMIILGWWCIPLETYIRYWFGERYYSPLSIFLSLIVLNIYRSIYILIAAFKGNVNPVALFLNPSSLGALFSGNTSFQLYFLFWWGYVLLAAIHIFVIKRREQQGIEWHTMSFGSSWLGEMPFWSLWNRLVRRLPWGLGDFIKVDDWSMYCLVEPYLIYLMSFTVYEIDPLLGTWLWVASFALFIKNMMVYYERRGRMLDIMDAAIESKYLGDALRGESKEHTAGFTVVPVPIKLTQTTSAVDNAAATVAETLKQSPQVTGE